MHREGHIGIGLVFYAPIAYVLAVYQLTAVLGFGLVGIAIWSFAPDFDMQLPFVSHRGITHTFLAAGVAGVLTAIIAVYLALQGAGGGNGFVLQPKILTLPAAALFGFMIGSLGVVAHLVGDVLTPMGIQPKQPFSDQKYTLELVYAKNERANEALMTLGGVAMVGAFVLAEGII